MLYSRSICSWYILCSFITLKENNSTYNGNFNLTYICIAHGASERASGNSLSPFLFSPNDVGCAGYSLVFGVRKYGS